MESINDQLSNPIFWSAMCIAGFFGFSIGIVTVLQIKATSPLSHNISGTAKAAVQSMMAFYIWGVSSIGIGKEYHCCFVQYFLTSLIFFFFCNHPFPELSTIE